jgi:YesN/AraC family two-component response regulator
MGNYKIEKQNHEMDNNRASKIDRIARPWLIKNFIDKEAEELKEIIQDHVDTNLNLTEISKSFEINPSFLFREFSKHFDNLSFVNRSANSE